jgi:hypothetical protein
MTGAMMLPSTDHMIQQYGEECLGTCGMFWLRLVTDDPEKVGMVRYDTVAGVSEGDRGDRVVRWRLVT